MVDDDPEALHCLLEFLYTGTYAYCAVYDGNGPPTTYPFQTDAEWIELIKIHAEVFSLADKYDIKKLKYRASTGVAEAWIDRIIPGDDYSDHGLA